MGAYFIRRLLLIIPTFFGSTIVVFIILQLAPGGPIEQTIRQLQAGSGGGGEAGGGGGGDMTGGVSIPKSALEELNRFYGFDKPIHLRYLMWLGLWQREIEGRNVEFGPDEFEATKSIGRGQSVIVKRTGADQFQLFNEDGTPNTEFKVRGLEPDEGKIRATFYKTRFSGLLTGDLGNSYTYLQPVTTVMKPRFKVSLFFGIVGLLLSYTICIPLGISKALRHQTPFDFFSSVLVFVGYSVPGWALGTILLMLLGGGSFWDVFPLGGFRSENWETLSLWGKIIDQAHHAVLPLIAWSIGSFATMSILMKNSLLENLSQDYVRTAFAKGLQEKRVVWLHTLRNSIIPIAARVGHIISVILTGSYLIEVAFNIDGFGKMGFQAVLDRDYPIIMGNLVIGMLLFLMGNVLSDVALASVDPRIRFK